MSRDIQDVLLLMMQVWAEVAAQKTSLLVKSKAPGTATYVPAPCTASVAAIWLSCLPIVPSPLPFVYNIVVLELLQGEVSGWLCWQIRRGRSF